MDGTARPSARANRCPRPISGSPRIASDPSRAGIAHTAYPIGRDQSAAFSIRLRLPRAACNRACCSVCGPSPTLSSLACQAKLLTGPNWIHEIKHDGFGCHHIRTRTDREQPTRKIVRGRQITRTSRARSKKWHAAGCYLPSKWSGWTARKRPKRATLPRHQEPLPRFLNLSVYEQTNHAGR